MRLQYIWKKDNKIYLQVERHFSYYYSYYCRHDCIMYCNIHRKYKLRVRTTKCAPPTPPPTTKKGQQWQIPHEMVLFEKLQFLILDLSNLNHTTIIPVADPREPPPPPSYFSTKMRPEGRIKFFWRPGPPSSEGLDDCPSPPYLRVWICHWKPLITSYYNWSKTWIRLFSLSHTTILPSLRFAADTGHLNS